MLIVLVSEIKELQRGKQNEFSSKAEKCKKGREMTKET